MDVDVLEDVDEEVLLDVLEDVDDEVLLVVLDDVDEDVLLDVLDEVVLVLLEKGEVGGLGDAGGDGKEHGRFHGLSVSGKRSGAKMR